MKMCGFLLVSKDLEKTKAFYWNLFHARVTVDFGANITLTGGLSFQSAQSWSEFLHKDESAIQYGGNNAEVYYECEDLDAFVQLAQEHHVEFVHPIQTHEWGQRGLRVYDPDHHIIEVSETMPSFVKRFAQQGMSVNDISKKTMLSQKMVEKYLKK